MTLEEAIKHCEEVAEEYDKDMKRYAFADMTTAEARCKKCAEEQRQLAEWLRELKDIKHLFSITEKLFKANFRDGVIDVVDGYDILFSKHNQLRGIFEGVNADDRN